MSIARIEGDVSVVGAVAGAGGVVAEGHVAERAGIAARERQFGVIAHHPQYFES